jgi:hypothetical protein
MSGVAALADALISNTTLLHLGMAQTGLGKQGGSMLADALVTNTTLRSLDVSHIDGVSVEHQAFIGSSLQRNREILEQQRHQERAHRASHREGEAAAVSAQALADAKAYAADWLEARHIKREAQRLTSDAAAADAEKEEAIQREDRYKRWRALTANTGKKKGAKKGKGKK